MNDARVAELKAAGARETVVFHSANEALLPYQGKFPFDVIGDPQKELYRRFGVESSPSDGRKKRPALA